MSENIVNVVLVTSSGAGFGKYIAKAFARERYDVICVDKDVELASRTAAEIEEESGRAIPLQADMALQLDVRKTFDVVAEIFGGISGIIHVNDVESQSLFQELSESEFSELVNGNIRSTYHLLKRASHPLSRCWVSLVGPPSYLNEPHMYAIQGALEYMARGFALNYPEVRVNLLIPSRAASDEAHDSPLIDNILHLADDKHGLNGHVFRVKLPPPPNVNEAMLPEVQAALDTSVRQIDLEDSIYDDDDFSEAYLESDDFFGDGVTEEGPIKDNATDDVNEGLDKALDEQDLDGENASGTDLSRDAKQLSLAFDEEVGNNDTSDKPNDAPYNEDEDIGGDGDIDSYLEEYYDLSLIEDVLPYNLIRKPLKENEEL